MWIVNWIRPLPWRYDTNIQNQAKLGHPLFHSLVPSPSWNISNVGEIVAIVGYLTMSVAQAQSHAQDLSWEGLWAVNEGQCNCPIGMIDQCPAGLGLPPLLLMRDKIRGPELSCDKTTVSKSTTTAFLLEATCASEGNEGNASIVGVIGSDGLHIDIDPSPRLGWKQGDYKTFPVKCAVPKKNSLIDPVKLKDLNGVWAKRRVDCDLYNTGKLEGMDRVQRSQFEMIGICPSMIYLESQPVDCKASELAGR